MSPAQAILWQIFRRNRWGFAAATAYLLFAIATSHLLTPYARTHWGETGVTFVGLYLGAPCALIIVVVIAAFCLSGSRAGESAPPAHMLVLPISTRKLVTVPMAAGAMTVTAVWLVVAWLVLRPADISAPMLWPAAVLILFLTIFQALAWTPFSQKWMQGILTVVTGVGTFGWVLGGIGFGFARFGATAEPFIALGSVAVLVPLAYLAALSGVAMTRRGDAYDWRQWSRLMDAIAAWRKPTEHPFSSPSAAQIWFECRTCGWYPPLMVGGIALFFPFILLTDPNDVVQSWKFLGIFVGLPIFTVMMAGGALGNIDGLSARMPQGQFLFVRPLTSAALVRDKLWMAALSTLACWLVLVPFALLFLLRPGFCHSIVELVRSAPAWKVVVLPPLTMLLVLACTWKQLVEGFWVALTGRAWLMHAFVVALLALVFSSFGFGLWINLHPEFQATATAAVPWIMNVALALKLLVATIVLRALLHSRLLPLPLPFAMLGVWSLVVVGLSALALWIIPPGSIPVSNMVSGIVLLIPFSRLAGAPLALEWNRHR